MASKSTFLRNAVFNAIFRNITYTAGPNLFFSFHTASPGLTGVNEVAGNNYARIALVMGAPTGGAGVSSAAVTSLPPTPANWGTLTHWGVWDAAIGGNFLGGDALTNPIVTSIGVPVTFPSGNITWSEI